MPITNTALLIYFCPVGEEGEALFEIPSLSLQQGNCPPLPSVTVCCAPPLSEVPAAQDRTGGAEGGAGCLDPQRPHPMEGKETQGGQEEGGLNWPRGMSLETV